MENFVVNENISNDFVLQSRSQIIEGIAETKNQILGIELPKEILEARRRDWQNLFDKYMEKRPDEVELNIDSLETEEDKESTDKTSRKNGQPAFMRKSAFLIQYWINTGNLPYKTFLEKDELSETGSSLSEEEIVSPVDSLLSTVIIDNVPNLVHSCNVCKSHSSYSSVDTAIYIMSNANIKERRKKKQEDIVAIIEETKHTDKSSEDCIKATDILSDDMTTCINTDVSENVEIEDVTSETCDQQTTGAAIVSNIMRRTSSQSTESCEKTDRNDMTNIRQNGLNMRCLDSIMSIFQQFDVTSKRLSQDAKTNDIPSGDEVLEEDNSQVAAHDSAENVNKDGSLRSLHRKKLYTGRNSPVDVMLAKKHSINKISEARKTLHPALHPECTTKRKSSSVHKIKNKRSHFRKGNSNSKIDKGAKRTERSTFNSNADTLERNSIGDNIVTNNSIRTPISDTSFINVSGSHNDLDAKQAHASLRNDDNTSISIKDKTHMQNLASLNLNPVVLLERIVLTCGRYTFDTMKNNDATQKDGANRYLKNELSIRKVESLDFGTPDSDDSSILICKCKKDISNCIPSSSQYFHYPISEKDSIPNVKKDGRMGKISGLKNLKSADIGRDKEAVVVLERLLPSQYNHKKKVYENRAHTTKKPQNSSAKDEEEILDESKMRSSDLHEITSKKIDNIKLREVSIVLERLPTDKLQFAVRSSNISKSTDKKNIPCDPISTNNYKRKLRTRVHVHKNVRKNPVRTVARNVDYSVIDISDVTSEEAENQTLGKIVPISQCENIDNEIECKEYSALASTSSDGNDFVQPIQDFRKRLETSTSNERNETKAVGRNSQNKTKLISESKDHFNENPGLVIHSSRKAASKMSNRSINKRTRQSRMKTKSFGASVRNITLHDSLHMNKSEIFSVLSSENMTDNNNTTENRKDDKRRKRKISVLNLNLSRDNNVDNREKRSNIRTNRNKIKYEGDIPGVLFQTETFYPDSLTDHEKSSNDTIFNCKTVPQINNSVRRSARYHDGTNNKKPDYSITKKYNKNNSNSLNSSVTNRMHDMITKSTSLCSRKAKINGRSTIYDGKPKDSINSKKSKRSAATHQTDAQSATELFTFQTKDYYDTDSNGSS